jgi:hypothetical protein
MIIYHIGNSHYYVGFVFALHGENSIIYLRKTITGLGISCPSTNWYQLMIP